MIWLYDNVEMRIEGRIIVRASTRSQALAARGPDHNLSFQGFDEFMNVVMDEATEVYVKDAKPRRELGMFPSFKLWGC